MHLVATIQVRPTPEQHHALLATMHECNRVANLVSQYAFATKTFSRRNLQQMLYPTLRTTSSLSSQQVILTIHKVADACQRDRTIEHRVRSEGAIAYDPRILRIYTEREEVSIRTLDGRVSIPYTTGDHHRELLRHPSGQADLCYRRGKFFLRVTCTLPDAPVVTTEGILGVDFGIVNIAVDSDGRVYSGERRDERRSYYERRRGALQRRGTRSAKKKLRSISGKQQRYQRNENHCIAKNIVDAASEGTKRTIALEELRGIRARTTVRRTQRSRQANWSFAQLREFITYKAQRRGIPVIVVDPRNTSRMCPVCDHSDKCNRPSQADFRCRACGYEKHADIVGALNISKRAAINSAYGVVGCPVGAPQMQATTSGGGS